MVLLAIAGAFVFFTAFFAWLANGHRGYINAAAIGLFAGGGWLMLASGVLHRATLKTRRMARRIGTTLVLVLFTVAGPPVSTSAQRSNEERKFQKLAAAKTDPTIDLQEWQISYTRLDPKFRRDGWEAAWLRARVERAIQDNDVAELRAILGEIEVHSDVAYSDAQSAAAEFLEDATPPQTSLRGDNPV